MTVVKIKKQKAQKSMSQKESLNLEIIKTVQKQLNLKKTIKHLLKNENGVGYFKKHHKELLKNNKLIFKTQQRFKSERKNVFNKVISNIALSLAYGASKDLVNEKRRN